MQRPIDAQRDGGGKFEKGNFVNGNVWQRDEDQLAEGRNELHSLLSGYAEAWFSGLFDEHQHRDGRPREGGPEKAVNASGATVVSQRVEDQTGANRTLYVQGQ